MIRLEVRGKMPAGWGSWLSLSKLVSNLVYGYWILELLSTSFVLRYEHRQPLTVLVFRQT